MFFLGILDGVWGLLLIQTFLKNWEPPLIFEVSKLKLGLYFLFCPPPSHKGIFPKFFRFLCKFSQLKASGGESYLPFFLPAFLSVCPLPICLTACLLIVCLSACLPFGHLCVWGHLSVLGHVRVMLNFWAVLNFEVALIFMIIFIFGVTMIFVVLIFGFSSFLMLSWGSLFLGHIQL